MGISATGDRAIRVIRMGWPKFSSLHFSFFLASLAFLAVQRISILLHSSPGIERATAALRMVCPHFSFFLASLALLAVQRASSSFVTRFRALIKAGAVAALACTQPPAVSM